MKNYFIFLLLLISTKLFAIDSYKLNVNGFETNYYYLRNDIPFMEQPEKSGKIIGKLNQDNEIYVNEKESLDDWLYCYVPKYEKYGYCSKEYLKRKNSFSSVMYKLCENDKEAIDMVKNHQVNSCEIDKIFYWFKDQNEETILKMIKYAYECGSFEYGSTTPLNEATINNYNKIVDYLLSVPEYKKDINSKKYDQYAPPLFWAISNCNIEIMEELLQNGANPNFTTADNKNAYKILDDRIKNNKISIEVANELKQMLSDYGYQFENPNNIKIDDKLTVTENLRLRTVQGAGLIITTIKQGSPVKVKLLGKYEVIDGINSRWFYIEVMDGAKDREDNSIKQGTSGWCYGGYLE
ncbi:ankyrin repeat domain-containing protein [Treponema bryantii]|uniref:ankyrin repeat domain-containing protein n=1 Tax=Treponema bryantii TaxID=163 RepID=UPI002B286ADA|nr:hypothetical protein TRBR_06250 [Treponema bryantii]